MVHKPTERVLSILTLLAAHPEGLSLTAITEILHIPKSTISPILQEMTQANFLQLQPDGNRYFIGIAAYCIGAAYEHDKAIIPYIKAEMKKISQATQEVCQAGVLDGPDVLYILKEEPHISPTIKITSYIGKKLPAYATALGKALLSSYTLEELQNLYPQPLEPLAPNTITDLSTLHKQFQEIKTKGIASESEEACSQLNCFAVLIQLPDTKPYAISVTMPLFRATEEKIALTKQLLLKAKEALEQHRMTLQK